MTNLSIGKAPENFAVLPFYGSAAAFFLILSVLLFFSADKLSTHYFNPGILAVVHLAALGWGTMIIFGAAYQLLPVICEKDLFSSVLALISYFFLTSGLILLTYTFWVFQTGWLMITGGTLIVVAAILYTVNVIKTTAVFSGFSIQKLFMVSSSAWLLLTVLIGLLLAINLAFPFFTKNHLDILKLHAHAGLAGWFLQLITGVSIRLVPMFLLGRSDKETLLRWSFLFQNLGLLLFLCDGYFMGISERSLLYAGIMFAGVICWLLYLRDVYKSRIKKKTELQMHHTFVAFSCLIIAILLTPAVYYSANVSWSYVYGIFLFFGWISSIILGMTFKTLPFIVWNSHYKKMYGKVKIPMPKHLYSEKLLKYQFWIFLAALYIIALSLIFQQHIALKTGLGLWVLLALLYAVNVGKTLTHKTIITDANFN